MFTNQIPLERIVVHKHHRIETDVQCLLDEFDVVSFVIPVRDKHRDVIQPQRHLRMIAERLLRRLFLVLAAHREDNPALLEFARPFLQRIERVSHAQLSDLYSLNSIISDHAAPNRVVQIEDQTLLKRAADSFDDVGHGLGNRRKKFQRERDLRHDIKPRIVRVRVTHMARQRRDVGNENLLVFLRQSHQPAVQLAQLKQKRTRRAIREVAEYAVVEFNQIELDDLRLAVRCDGLPPVLEIGKDLIREQRFRIRTEMDKSFPEFFGREIENDKLWIRVIQLTAGIQNLPIQLIVVRLENLKIDLLLVAVTSDCLGEKLRRRITQKSHPPHRQAGKILVQITLEVFERHGGNTLRRFLELEINERRGIGRAE